MFWLIAGFGPFLAILGAGVGVIVGEGLFVVSVELSEEELGVYPSPLAGMINPVRQLVTWW